MVDSAFWSDRAVDFARIRAENRGALIRLDYCRHGWNDGGWASRWDMNGGTAAARQDFVRTLSLCATGCGWPPTSERQPLGSGLVNRSSPWPPTRGRRPAIR
jgi:hypothetical protein